MPNYQFFRRMLKIPTFILGGLLILTGLAGYLFQDAGLSLKLTGPLADDAEFTLSDGNDSVVVDLGFPSSKSAGEYAFWMVHRLNQNHAKDRSQANYAVEQGSTAYETQSFWHASSKGDTQDALVLHAETGELGNLAETDANRSTVRLVYKNFTGNTNPVTLTSTNWTNVESKVELKPGDSLEFYKSWTAFIPGIIGIILIALVQAAEIKPNAKKAYYACSSTYRVDWIYHASLQDVAKCNVRDELAKGRNLWNHSCVFIEINSHACFCRIATRFCDPMCSLLYHSP